MRAGKARAAERSWGSPPLNGHLVYDTAWRKPKPLSRWKRFLKWLGA